MLSILLIRSGRTEYECQGRIQGMLDVPLSEDGRREVLAGAAELVEQQASIKALYAGPCRSAQETADILADQLKLKVKTLDTKTPYIAVCDTGRRSSAAAFLLSERGFESYCLQGGMTGNQLGPEQ